MGDAGIEPDVEDVGDAVVVLRLVAEQFGRVERVPDVHPALLHSLCDGTHDLGAARMRLAALAMHEQRDRLAPGALARDRPVRPALEHARSDEHTSELQSLIRNTSAVYRLK